MTAALHRAADNLIRLARADMMIDLPQMAERDAADQASALAVNIIRVLIGRVVSHHLPAADAPAFKAQLAHLLGQPVGQLLRGQSPLIVAAALEGHTALLAATLGATPHVTVRVAKPKAKPH